MLIIYFCLFARYKLEVKNLDIVDHSDNNKRENGKAAVDYPALLNKFKIEFDPEVKTSILYQKIVDTAVEIMGSQNATMQILYPDPGRWGKLLIVASHGFSPEAEKYWEWVYHYTSSSCSQALKTRRRVLVPDYRTAEFMRNSPTLSVFIEGGIFAAQSTPIYSKTGVMLRMISTHWDAPHTPEKYQLDLIDVLSFQAADLLERSSGVEP